jgi:hypothetical protein
MPDPASTLPRKRWHNEGDRIREIAINSQKRKLMSDDGYANTKNRETKCPKAKGL